MFRGSLTAVRLGVLLVLLTPCIDYVVTFSHLGRADAGRLLAATPVLLAMQALLLPVYLGLFLGAGAATAVRVAPFVHAFVGLIVIPLSLSALLQHWAARAVAGRRLVQGLACLPVPATALVLFVVVAATVPRLGAALPAVARVLPLYGLFALVAPWLGAWVGRLFRLEASARRAVSFSAGTRNSLVVLPLALAVPGAVPLLPAVIVSQTLIELLAELCYIRVIARWVRDAD